MEVPDSKGVTVGAMDAVGHKEMDEETLPVMLSVCDTSGLEETVTPQVEVA